MNKITLFLIFAFALNIGIPTISSARLSGGLGAFGGGSSMRGGSMHSFGMGGPVHNFGMGNRSFGMGGPIHNFGMGNRSFGMGRSTTGFSRLGNATNFGRAINTHNGSVVSPSHNFSMANSIYNNFGMGRSTTGFSRLGNGNNFSRVSNTHMSNIHNNGVVSSTHNLNSDRRLSDTRNFGAEGNGWNGGHEFEERPFFNNEFAFVSFGFNPFFFSPFVFAPFVFSPFVFNPFFFNPFFALNFGFVY